MPIYCPLKHFKETHFPFLDLFFNYKYSDFGDNFSLNFHNCPTIFRVS